MAQSPFDALFDELLIEIFARCDLKTRLNAEGVCRRWKRMSRRAWRNLDKLTYSEFFSYGNFPRGKWMNKSLHWVLKRTGKQLKILDMTDPEPESRWVRVNEKTMKIIGHFCKNLREVYFTSLKMLNDHLHEFAKWVDCSKIRVLDYDGSFNHHCPVFDGLSVVYLKCPVLEEINISNSINARVRDCREPWAPTLRRVSLDHAMAFTSYSLYSLTKDCPDLEAFSMGGRSSGMDSGLEVIFTKAVKLRELSLSDYQSSGDIGPNIANLRQLRRLYLGGSTIITDRAVQAISASCPLLEEMDLSAHSYWKETLLKCQTLSDSSLEAIARFLPTLKQLHLDYRHKITDYGVSQIGANGHLRVLSLVNCEQVGDASLSVLGRACHGLQSLNVSTESGVTTGGLLELCHAWFDYDGSPRAYLLDLTAEEMTLEFQEFLNHFQRLSDEEHDFISGQHSPRRVIRLNCDMIMSLYL